MNAKAVLKGLGGIIFVGLLVFLCAGRIAYWQGVLYMLVMVAMIGVSVACVADNPELIQERLKPGKGTKQWDKIYWAISTPLFFCTLVISALDTGRYQWSPSLPWYVYAMAAAVYVSGSILFAWARHANHFFSSVVRIQTERGHSVCQKGPYRYVRHPGYTGGILYTAVTPLLFGSLWGLLPALLTVALMLIRTSMEDKALANELEGYRAYQQKVRYRLIPYLW